MDKNILIFIFILVILFIGHVFLNESFNDMVGSVPVDSIPIDSVPVDSVPVDSVPVDSEEVSNLKSEIYSDIAQSLNNTLDSPNIMTDSCINSISEDQGADFMRYIPGKNPADYIRKDSIPCYKCSIP
jgi:hypothetical protein